MEREVTTTYLEMTSPSALRPTRTRDGRLDVVRAEIPSPELNRFLYTAVGSEWYWCDRLSWSYQRWLEYLSLPDVETWVGYVRGTPAGYFELERKGTDVELAYFGLLPSFVGKGLGGDLLTTAVERAWAMNPLRVWVHTCDLDHPAALANYEARGFRVYRTETKAQVVPDRPVEAWSAATLDTVPGRHVVSAPFAGEPEAFAGQDVQGQRGPRIRILGSGDRAVLDNVAPGVFDNVLDPRLVSEFLGDGRHHLVVAVDRGQVIGAASGVHYVHPDKPSQMWINEVGVAASHQGQGIGKAMIQELLRHARRLGCSEAWVLTDRANHPAMRLYASTGGQEAPHDQVMFTFFLDGNNRNSRAAG